MPIDAWKKIANAVRLVREAGLFGDWVGRGGGTLRRQYVR
jgi:hypothetical protein